MIEENVHGAMRQLLRYQDQSLNVGSRPVISI